MHFRVDGRHPKGGRSRVGPIFGWGLSILAGAERLSYEEAVEQAQSVAKWVNGGEGMVKDCGREVEPPGIPAKLAAPARRALANAGILTLRDLARRTEAEVMKLHGMGPNAIRTLRLALQERGMSFADGKYE